MTINTDNRLMSATSVSRELGLMVEHASWTVNDLHRVAVDAMKSAFIPYDQRRAMIRTVITPAYEALGG